MPSLKWFDTERDVQKGDVVFFLKDKGVLHSEYKYGMIEDIKVSKDGRIRSVTMLRTLLIIHRVDEVDLFEELGNAVTYANGVYCMGE